MTGKYPNRQIENQGTITTIHLSNGETSPALDLKDYRDDNTFPPGDNQPQSWSTTNVFISKRTLPVVNTASKLDGGKNHQY